MKLPAIGTLFYHRDYDGLVAAAMVGHASTGAPHLRAVQYSHDLRWRSSPLPPGSAIVDFLYHPDAVLWVDHHATTFGDDDTRERFRPGPFHVFDGDAPSCPGLIARVPWFEPHMSAHWLEYVHWADIIDSASYDSPAQANSIENPHILLSHTIGECERSLLPTIVHGVARMRAAELVETPALSSVVGHIRRFDQVIRSTLDARVRLDGGVAHLDQSDLPIPYRRYLPYEVFPGCSYAIGKYATEEGVIVSVGENPWNPPRLLHLGELCREFGGGGRRGAAGVPVRTREEASELALALSGRLNAAMDIQDRFSAK